MSAESAYSTSSQREMNSHLPILGYHDYLDDREPFVLRIAGVSTQPVKEFATNLRFRAIKGNKVPPRVCFKGIEKATQYGTTYYVQPSIEGTVGEEDMSVISLLVSDLLSPPAAPVSELPQPVDKQIPAQGAFPQQAMESLTVEQTSDESGSSLEIDF